MIYSLNLDDVFKDSLSGDPLFDSLGEHLEGCCRYIVSLGMASGATFVELFFEKTKGLDAIVQNGVIDKVVPNFILGCGIKVEQEDKTAFVATNILSLDSLKKGIEQALSMLGLSIVDPVSSVLPEVYLEPFRDYSIINNKWNWDKDLPKSKDIFSFIREMDSKANEDIPHIQISNTHYFSSLQEILICSSEGTFAKDLRLLSHVGTGITVEDKGDRFATGRRFERTSMPNFLSEVPVSDMIQDLRLSAEEMLHAEYAKSQSCPIVLGNGFGGVIFHEACGHLLETNILRRGGDVFKDKLGQKIAHEAVTAWDEGRSPYAPGSIDMDDEGMPSQRTLLIENGILKNYMADRQGSLRFKVPKTGSGRRENYKFAATSRMRNTYFAPGKYAPEEIIATIDDGIYCKKLGGGSVNFSGEFNFVATEAFVIKKGKISHPVKGAILIGSAKDILPKISMVGNDLYLKLGFCGSTSGSVPVSVGQPHIKVDNISIGGR